MIDYYLTNGNFPTRWFETEALRDAAYQEEMVDSIRRTEAVKAENRRGLSAELSERERMMEVMDDA